ncbi:concanavalin A-like lectin/glucanase [Byssothecium circinans]|uniref:Concanavalin A-like lectin/glucanase n=1 Tax=Byssothecium circinans TaxID=147558 RepID=A0A6A5U679_9PLEO|nr:concanavalin A-like lectin/glucanase [Byssothecium circinans]
MLFTPYQTALLSALPFLGTVSAALDPSCRPGGNFALKKWDLETSIDNGSGQPKVISGSELTPDTNACSNGWQDKGSAHQWFFTESTDGSMVMKAPGYSSSRPCIKWSGSNHCRTEFHETTAAWSTSNSLNRLHVKLSAGYGSNICIGQVFQSGTGFNKPYLELYYHPGSGDIIAGVATCPEGGNAGCNQAMTTVGNVAMGTVFTYDVQFEGGVLKVAINGKVTTLKTFFTTPKASFKFGNYNQGTDDASVHVFELSVQH